jgi:anaerobic selenocysteine-containing dehydrogenase
VKTFPTAGEGCLLPGVSMTKKQPNRLLPDAVGSTPGCNRWHAPDVSRQPYSPKTIDRHARIRDAQPSRGVCPYCAVGCGQLIYTKQGTIVDIEGDPDSPINEGTLCPKGANGYEPVR